MDEDIGELAMYGGNRNVNISSPDSKDNKSAPDYKRRRGMSIGDYFQLSLGVSLMAIVYIFIWFFAINISNFYCWTKYDVVCHSTNWVHSAFVIGLIIAIILLAAYGIQQVWNAGYLFQRGVYLDRRQVSTNAGGLIDVMKTSAKSEATYGLDTYSPSISKNITGVDKPAIVDSVEGLEGAIAITGSPLDDVINED